MGPLESFSSRATWRRQRRQHLDLALYNLGLTFWPSDAYLEIRRYFPAILHIISTLRTETCLNLITCVESCLLNAVTNFAVRESSHRNQDCHTLSQVTLSGIEQRFIVISSGIAQLPDAGGRHVN